MYVPSSPYTASVLKGIISNRVLGFKPVTFGVYGYKPAPLLHLEVSIQLQTI